MRTYWAILVVALAAIVAFNFTRHHGDAGRRPIEHEIAARS
jgi:hypothetical protein